jgi:predicted TIM-barrel fold metal-dependent hydrolase
MDQNAEALAEMTTTNPPPIDCHVHLVGNGKSGSGCWLRLGATWWQKPLAAYMLRHVGLGDSSLQAPDFDERYVAHLLRLVRESSVGSVMLLAQDEVFHPDGTKMENTGSFHVPNDYVLRLAREHPEFLPVVSIHPARRDALDELDRCLAGGAVMLKLLPNCHNVDCNDPRYRKFWERMAQARLPLLAHTGGEHTVQVVNAAYSDPRVLTLPLECGVPVIAAHSATKSGLGDPQYFHVFTDMLAKWPNLYGDTSAWNVSQRGRFAKRCVGENAGLLGERLLHGSDFPVPCSGLWAWLRRTISFADWCRCRKITNVIERDYQLKLAMGFGPEHFTRVRSLLRQ